MSHPFRGLEWGPIKSSPIWSTKLKNYHYLSKFQLSAMVNDSPGNGQLGWLLTLLKYKYFFFFFNRKENPVWQEFFFCSLMILIAKFQGQGRVKNNNNNNNNPIWRVWVIFAKPLPGLFCWKLKGSKHDTLWTQVQCPGTPPWPVPFFSCLS